MTLRMIFSIQGAVELLFVNIRGSGRAKTTHKESDLNLEMDLA